MFGYMQKMDYHKGFKGFERRFEQMRRTIINITAQTKERLEQLKNDYCDNPEASNEQFLNDMMDFCEEQTKQQEEVKVNKNKLNI